jgi:hypothetical protein
MGLATARNDGGQCVHGRIDTLVDDGVIEFGPVAYVAERIAEAASDPLLGICAPPA